MHKTILTLALAALLVPAFAIAAEPAHNSHFQWCQTQTRCPMTFNTNGTGTRIRDLNIFLKCSPVPVKPKGTFPRIAISESGRFHRSGTATDFIGNTITYRIRGRFRRHRKAVGVVEIDSVDKKGKRCNDRERDFVAKRTGPRA